MNNTGGAVDVWIVTGIDEWQLIQSGNGFCHYPARIPPGQVALIERLSGEARRDLPARERKKQQKEIRRAMRWVRPIHAAAPDEHRLGRRHRQLTTPFEMAPSDAVMNTTCAEYPFGAKQRATLTTTLPAHIEP